MPLSLAGQKTVSFILRMEMNLFEQQSTYPTNMPVRDLMYVGKLYDKHIKKHKYNIYGEKRIKLPMPRLVTLYNGKRNIEDCELHLCDSFDEGLDRNDADVAVRVHLININQGHNEKLLEKCRPLYEYSWLVDKIRAYYEQMEIDAAVDRAVEEIPEDFLLRDFLVANRAEVKDTCLTEYDEAETMQMFKEEGRKEGIVEGRKESLVESIKELMKNLKISTEQAMDALGIPEDKRQEILLML